MNHDHDEELGMYWYSEDGKARQEMLVQPRRVSVHHGPARDKKYWEQTFDLTLEYLRLQAATRTSTKLDEAFMRWLTRTPYEMRSFALGDDVARAEQVDRFLTVHPDA